MISYIFTQSFLKSDEKIKIEMFSSLWRKQLFYISTELCLILGEKLTGVQVSRSYIFSNNEITS